MNEEENKGGVADEYATEKVVGSFIKGTDLDGEGLTGLEVVKMEKFTPSVGDDGTVYGVKNTYGAGGALVKEHWFIKQGILTEGQSFKYSFTKDGEETSFDNSSLGFYFAFTKVNPKAGEKVSIKRDKKSNTDITWTITID